MAAATLTGAVGCSGPTADHNTASTVRPSQVGLFNDKSVPELVDALTHAGLKVPNPHDVTATACPSVGCIQEVDSDTVDIMKFPDTRRAELYIGNHPGVFQVADVVVRFPGVTDPARREDYQRVVTRAIQ